MFNFKDEKSFLPGEITYYYESGKRNILEAVGVISSGKNDPGGKSYGIFQLASNTDTLKNFIHYFKIKYSEFFIDLSYANIFENIVPASAEFDDKWRFLAQQVPINFGKIQHAFIAETHFLPLMLFLKDCNIAQDKITPAIQEALWSLGVQHGKAKIILQNTLDDIKTITEEQIFIECLYKNRSHYIRQLTTLSPQIKENITKRYQLESEEIIKCLITRKRECSLVKI